MLPLFSKLEGTRAENENVRSDRSGVVVTKSSLRKIDTPPFHLNGNNTLTVAPLSLPSLVNTISPSFCSTKTLQ